MVGQDREGQKERGEREVVTKSSWLECGVKKHSESRFWTHREVS